VEHPQPDGTRRLKVNARNDSGLGKETAMYEEKLSRKKLHKDWRTWLIVALMLAAIGMYVLTLDDSIVPASPTGSHSQASTPSSKP
jgi:hypothetical protein